MNIESVKQEFDANLYSRQVGTFGVETMNKFVKLRVLVIGLGGVGVEVAKNLILAGPKSVTVYDQAKVTVRDLESNYYVNEEKIAKGMTRGQATVQNLAELNNYVVVENFEPNSIDELFGYDRLQNYDVVVVTEWYDIHLIKRLGDACHALRKGFIFAAAAGLSGVVFVDFGPAHVINDKDGEECAISLVSAITEDGIVTTQEGQRHNLLEGDAVRFSEIVGMDKLNNGLFKVQKVITPYSFSIGDLKPLNVGTYLRNGIIQQVKEPKTVAFSSLSETLEDYPANMLDADHDYEHENRAQFTKMMIVTYWQYVSEFGVPEFYDEAALAKFEAILSSKLLAAKKTEEWRGISESHLRKFFFSLAPANLCAVQSFFGAIAAQEVVKFTGKYTPISQWFVHEWYWAAFKKHRFEDFLAHKADAQAAKNTRYQSHIALLGADRHRRLADSNVYMIGAGALGCEYLKFFAMAGLSCGKGALTVTDDDTIEVSNLNRQFLFRHKHIGGSKSEIACAEAKRMNAHLNAIAKKNRASPDTEAIFTDAFWDSLDFVVNAVDNIKARQYVDQKCVFHEKPLFEAGTLGTKCNSQLVLPGLTEAYSDSTDPQEKQVPMCTMRSFPFLIDHCIEWARGRFTDMFVQTSKFLKEFYADPDAGKEKFRKEVKTNVSAVKELCENLVLFLPLLENPRPEAYVKFARDFYQYAFCDQIRQLLTSFPEDAKDKDGNLFWTSPKRPPVVVPFDENSPDHLAFIASIVNILQQFIVPLNPIHVAPSELQNILRGIQVREVKIDNSEEARARLVNEAANANADATTDTEALNNVCATLYELAKSPTQIHFEELEFEKDNDANGHIDFIAFTANSRAANYKIEAMPRHRIKIIAGKIIPAIATTTAMVSGAVVIEIYKQLLGVPLDGARNFFSNLAIPIFMFSEPSPPVVHLDKKFDQILLGPVVARPPKYNTWARIEIQGPKTLNQISEEVHQKHGFSLSSFMAGNLPIYNSYQPNLAKRLDQTLEEILKEAGYQLYPGRRYVQVSIGGETDDMIDVDCPYMKYRLAPSA